jgi:hypothetical protein
LQKAEECPQNSVRKRFRRKVAWCQNSKMIKIKIMKPNTINQEVLLFTGTSFSKRQLCERDHATANDPLDPSEELQKACWSGMLFEMLPDLFENSSSKTFVWEVMPAKTFIRVKLGTASETIENETSINSHFLLSVKNFN